jgi:asparagine synthase (glutamine-hydrolysing)
MTGHYQPLIETTAARASSDGVRLMVYGIGGDLMMGEYLYDYPGLFFSGKWKTLLRELGMQRRWRRLSYWKAFDRFLIRPLPQVLWPPGRAPRIRELARRARPWTRRPRCYPAWLRKDWLQSLGAETLDDPPIPRVHVPGFARRSRYSLVFTPSHYRIAVWLERTHARFGMGFADPWSDRRIAEFAIAVPQRLLNRTGQDKRLVRMAMQGIMPETARNSARKILPSPLLDLALRQKEQNTVRVLITASRAAEMGFVDEAQLRLEYESIRSGKGDDGSFWAALELEMWLRGNAMIVT